jgi:prepilin-type N-terminal cleavage/methylation domain-containing protein
MTTRSSKDLRKGRGFTLVEMIGVLAVVAVMSALMIPRVFTIINESRVNATAATIAMTRSAVFAYFGKYGRFAGTNGTALPAPGTGSTTNWATEVLLPEGFLERPFATRIASGARLNVAFCITSNTAANATNTAYDFDGNSDPVNEAGGGQYVIEAVLTGVATEDARDLNRRIDGDDPSLGESAESTDMRGRVKYEHGASGFGNVKVYIAHR